jgi:pyruvate/2-oxoglutarate dehydrogenase complex dihydrolipoamide acyltransferase (E2) component
VCAAMGAYTPWKYPPSPPLLIHSLALPAPAAAAAAPAAPKPAADAAAPAKAAAPAPAAPAKGTTVPFTSMQAAVARNMMESMKVGGIGIGHVA